MDLFAPDHFLSAAMGRSAWVLTALPGAEDQREFLRHCAERRADPLFFATAKVPVCDVAGLGRVLAAGFAPVDVSLNLSRPARPQTADSGGWPGLVRMARPEDEQAVRCISAESLTLSRFHLDPRLGPALGARIKAQWAGNYFSGGRGQGMAVAEAEGRVAGFLLYLLSGGALVIDLLAVDRDFRRRGAGAAMLAFLESARLPGVERLAVGTQAVNQDSVRFYESQGLRYVGATHVLHAHGE